MNARWAWWSAAAVAALAATGEAQDEERPLRVYDVSLLVQPAPDSPGPDLDSGAEAEPGADVEAPFDPDDLVALITETVAADSWTHPVARCRVAGRTLEVAQTPEVHAQLAAFLATLRRELARQVEVAVEAWRVTPAQARAVLAASRGGRGTFAPGGAAAALAGIPGARLLDQATVTLRPGQRAHAAALRARTYVADVDVQVAQEAQIGEPVVGLQQMGLVADVRAVPCRDDARIVLGCRLAWADLADATRSANTEAGAIELPERRVLQAYGSARLEFGATWIATAAGPDGAGVCFCVTPRQRALGDGGVTEPPGPLVTRAYALHEITRAAPDLPGRSLAATLTADDGATAGFGLAASGDADDGRLAPQDVADALQQAVAPDSWSQAGVRLDVREHTLLVTQASAVHAAVAAWLGRLAAARPPPLRVEAALVSADSALLAALARRPGEPLEAAVIDGWLAANGERILAHASSAAQNQQRVHAGARRTVPVIGEFDAQVAQDARILDPVVRVGLEGFVLDVRPTRSADGRAVACDVCPDFAQVVRPIRVVTTPHGELSLLEVTRLRAELSPLVPIDAWTATRHGNDAAGQPLVLLLAVRPGE